MSRKAEEISDSSKADLSHSDLSLNLKIPGYFSSSLPSEPPDIRNWFSSYIYESPSLDAENELKFLASEETDSEKLGVFSQENDRGQEEQEEESRAPGGQRRSFNEGDKWREISGNEGNHYIEGDGDAFISKVGEYGSVDGGQLEDVKFPFKDLTSCLKNEYSLEKPAVKVIFCGDLLEDCKRNHLEDKDCRKEDDCLSSQRNVESRISEGASLDTSCGDLLDWGCKKNHLGDKCSKEENNYSSSQGNAVSRRSDGTSLNASMPWSTNGKEEGNEYKENGFISVKKNKQKSENGGSSLHIISQKNHVANEVHERVGRRPLSERTNFQFDVPVPEIAGKWKCPQKSKPDFGPPLKQLRLERWVHRLQ